MKFKPAKRSTIAAAEYVARGIDCGYRRGRSSVAAFRAVFSSCASIHGEDSFSWMNHEALVIASWRSAFSSTDAAAWNKFPFRQMRTAAYDTNPIAQTASVVLMVVVVTGEKRSQALTAMGMMRTTANPN